MLLVERLLGTRLEVLTKLVPLYAGTAALLLLVLIPVGPRRIASLLAPGRLVRPVGPARTGGRSTGRFVLTGVGALAAGAGAGLVLAWVLSDVVDVVGVHFTPVIRMWFALAGAGAALGVVRTGQRQRRRRRVLAAALVPAALLAGAFGINVDAAAFPTLNALLHQDHIRALPRLPTPAALADVHGWRPRGPLPAHGVLGTVRIPATTSGFPARPAVVYLPPAALAPDPPRLPVLLSLSGQPGWPSDVFVNGGMARVLDRYAAAHHGVAPVVIAADQLGLPGNNPMCLDSGLGHVDRYLTRDVRSWAVAHLPVASTGWGVEGFSEGGTCAMQLLAGHPDLFEAALAIAPEAVPDDRGEANTIREAFGGDPVRYRAATPVGLLHRFAPYPEDLAVVGFGSDDTDYGPDSLVLARAAARAGMAVSVVRIQGGGHDWNTVASVLGRGTPEIAAHLLRERR